MSLPTSVSMGKVGLIGAGLAVTFLLIFTVLGFLQPGYNHLGYTISSLVVGEFGWIQTLNFFVLAGAFVFIGLGLGKSITGRNFSSIFYIFCTFAASACFLAIMPADKSSNQEVISLASLSTPGKIHWLFVLVLGLFTPAMLFPVIQGMRKNKEWKSLLPLSIGFLVFNLIVGVSWYALVSFGYLHELKGIIQKILVFNVVVWLSILGYKIWVLDKYRKSP